MEFGDVESGLVLLGLVGLIDPPRREAVAAVVDCHAAGIRVKMITGDHAGTVAAIGRQVGLQNPDQVLTGADLDRLGDAALAAAVMKADVFARTSPEHKLRLVMALQSQGMTVAMTGDGVNDAPALKRADARHRHGTEAFALRTRHQPQLSRTRHSLRLCCAADAVKSRATKKAEVAVQIVQRFVLARLRNRRFFSLDEQNASIRECVADLNARIMRKLGKSRRELLETIERPALKPLPAEPYRYCAAIVIVRAPSLPGSGCANVVAPALRAIVSPLRPIAPITS